MDGSTSISSISTNCYRRNSFKRMIFHFQCLWLSLLVLEVIRPAAGTITVVSELSNATVATINDLPARFIPERFSFYGIQGYMVYADPPTACTKVLPPPRIIPSPDTLDYTINWILLAKRSPDCHFQTKIEMAQTAGYTAIIIHNVGSNSTEIMGVEDPTRIIIYATFVGEYDGQVLKNYTYSNTTRHGPGYFIRIQDDFSINGYLLPFAIVVGLCFIVMIIFMVRLLWQQVLRWVRDRRRSRRRKLPASALKKLPTQKWTKGDPYETCAVCLDDFVEQDKIRILPCSHGFHQVCIDPWLTKGRRVCPICKRKVVIAEERRRESDSDTDDETAPLLGTSAPSNPPNANGEETFVQRGESSHSLANPEQSTSTSPVRHTLPRVHTRGRRNIFSIMRSRQREQNPPAAVPLPPPGGGGTDSDSTASSSIATPGSSRSRSAGASPSHGSQLSTLAEVHHSTEVLRQKMEDLERKSSSSGQGQQDNQNQNVVGGRDNSVYIHDGNEVMDDSMTFNLMGHEDSSGSQTNWSSYTIQDNDNDAVVSSPNHNGDDSGRGRDASSSNVIINHTDNGNPIV